MVGKDHGAKAAVGLHSFFALELSRHVASRQISVLSFRNPREIRHFVSTNLRSKTFVVAPFLSHLHGQIPSAQLAVEGSGARHCRGESSKQGNEIGGKYILSPSLRSTPPWGGGAHDLLFTSKGVEGAGSQESRRRLGAERVTRDICSSTALSMPYSACTYKTKRGGARTTYCCSSWRARSHACRSPSKPSRKSTEGTRTNARYCHIFKEVNCGRETGMIIKERSHGATYEDSGALEVFPIGRRKKTHTWTVPTEAYVLPAAAATAVPTNGTGWMHKINFPKGAKMAQCKKKVDQEGGGEGRARRRRPSPMKGLRGRARRGERRKSCTQNAGRHAGRYL